MRLFFSVGEPSGDQHAAHLITELQRRNPAIECVGYGGPEMAAVGCKIDFQLTDLAVMGIGRVLPLLGKFYSLVQKAKKLLDEHRPDAVVLVDFPGFNWYIAKAAKQRGIPVIYYLPPQIWAWGGWRIHKVRKYVDHVLCALPFEAEWYREQGIDAEYVGHPFFDEIAEKQLDGEFLKQFDGTDRRIVGILPGSRTQEVAVNFPIMLKVMEQLTERQPHVQFHVACYRDKQYQQCRQILEKESVKADVCLAVGKTSEIISAAECCLMVSGSVCLELLATKTPAVVMYRTTYVMALLVALLIRCRFMTLVNLIAKREVMPEVAFCTSPRWWIIRMTEYLHCWLSSEKLLDAKRDELRQIAEEIVGTGATERTANAILLTLNTSESHQAQAA
ncbi:lipid-A-disaccharide synthase [Calycomorphotria hydatis]|uniref:Lipid-A-disaccharide synthase n=1 Tax=Calycomorphotria hydatis TaxID=2528027 RepID=A0A517TBC7_9PLAN|nr:lipid-A-disaccharide synthase [Calycomorphotria hydatis]QDT65667.1 Glycosyl transferase [Calycomorphotria hydatis]